MIIVDIQMPKKCDDCPFSYMIRSGVNEGRIMCNAMEARGRLSFREDAVVYNPYDPDEYLIDAYLNSKPDNCPIMGEVSYD